MQMSLPPHLHLMLSLLVVVLLQLPNVYFTFLALIEEVPKLPTIKTNAWFVVNIYLVDAQYLSYIK